MFYFILIEFLQRQFFVEHMSKQILTQGWLRKPNNKSSIISSFWDFWSSISIWCAWVSTQRKQAHSSLGHEIRIWSSPNQIKPPNISWASLLGKRDGWASHVSCFVDLNVPSSFLFPTYDPRAL
jgi:hypothetical protein